MAFGPTVSLKLPSKSVMVPFVVPFSSMLAPMAASPLVSTTRPEICLFCAYTHWLNVARQSISIKFFMYTKL